MFAYSTTIDSETNEAAPDDAPKAAGAPKDAAAGAPADADADADMNAG